MKEVVAVALREMVVENFGLDRWTGALGRSGFDVEPLLTPLGDMEDALVLRIVEGVCQELEITLEQAADAFGDYWVNVYSQRLYEAYYTRAKNAREFFLKLDRLHHSITRTIEGARPPRFEYEEPDPKTLLITYISHRPLIDFLVGMARGVGKFYGERLVVTKLSSEKVKIVFA